MGERGGAPGPRPGGLGLRITGVSPSPASTANGRQQRQSVNLKLARALDLASNARDTLVIRSSLGGDED